MRKLLKVLVLTSALSLPACNGGDDSATPASLGQEFVIRYGETIRIDNLLLEFTSVLEESRCPVNAICVWEGNARLVFTASQGPTTRALELNTTPPFPTTAIFEGYVIELRELQPYPGAVITKPLPLAYVATLFVDGLVLPAN